MSGTLRTPFPVRGEGIFASAADMLAAAAARPRAAYCAGPAAHRAIPARVPSPATGGTGRAPRRFWQLRSPDLRPGRVVSGSVPTRSDSHGSKP